MASDTRPLAADLFCGSGSVSAALQNSGFEVAFAVDNDAAAVATYRANHYTTKLFDEDIANVSTDMAKETLGGRWLSVLAVCAPCQPFSSQNRKRGADDPRASLVLETLRFAKDLKPETIWIENVPGLATSHKKEALRNGLRALGYQFNAPLQLNANSLGVPQRRIRSIFVASRADTVLERIEKFRSDFSGMPVVSVRQAFRNLSKLEPGQRCAEDPLHIAAKHTKLTVQRLQAIPTNGGSRSSLPIELQLACHRKLDKNSFPDVYGRMSWDRPAPTLTTGCTDVTRGRFAHPEENRAITLREAARLQTFPDNYNFKGSNRDKARLIGNAVPYQMALKLFRWMFMNEWPKVASR